MAAAIDAAQRKARRERVDGKLMEQTPVTGKPASHKATCLRRKNKSKSRAFDSRSDGSSQELEVEITKRLNFDDINLDDDEVDSPPPAPPAKPTGSVKSTPRATTTSKFATHSPQTRGPIRNTCILESPLDHKRSSRKRRIYGVRRNEPQLTRKRPKRSIQRPVSFPLCALQRMFAP